MIDTAPIAMGMEPTVLVFGLPLITGTPAGAAIQAHMADLYDLIGVNGATWRALRRENRRRQDKAQRYGTKLGTLESLPTEAHRRPAAAG